MEVTALLDTYEGLHGPQHRVRDFVDFLHGGFASKKLPKKYNVIVVDPPWPYKSRRMVQKKGTHMAGIEDEYDTMTMKDMMELPIDNMCADNCLMYMWATGPKLKEAFMLLDAWNFKYSTVAYVWEKKSPNIGFYSLSSCEYVLVAKRGKAPPRNKNVNFRQFYQEQRTTHSTKPEGIEDMIEKQFNLKGLNKIELFARRFRQGWDCVGNELNGTIEDFLNGKKMKLRK